MAQVEYTPREVVADQLLVALNDRTKAAIVLDVDGLDLLIQCVAYMQRATGEHTLSWHDRQQMLNDLRDLREACFGIHYKEV